MVAWMPFSPNAVALVTLYFLILGAFRPQHIKGWFIPIIAGLFFFKFPFFWGMACLIPRALEIFPFQIIQISAKISLESELPYLESQHTYHTWEDRLQPSLTVPPPAYKVTTVVCLWSNFLLWFPLRTQFSSPSHPIKCYFRVQEEVERGKDKKPLTITKKTFLLLIKYWSLFVDLFDS